MADATEDFPVRVDALQANPGRQKNSIITSKYNLLTFLPMQLFELLNPLSRFANFYFLVVGFLQMVPEISITNSEYFGDVSAASVWQTLVFMLVVDMCLNAKEEINRHRSDSRTNSQRCAVLQEGDTQLTTITWAKVKVGMVVKVYAREHFPADLVLLRGSDPQSMGQCWANTKPLDGETDTKLRLAPKAAVELLRGLTEDDVRVEDRGAASPGTGPAIAESSMVNIEVDRTRSVFTVGDQVVRSRLHELLKGAYVACEAPNDKVNDFSGQLYLQGHDPCFLQRENMLLRGCQLRNTDWALGIVVSTGTDAKINFTKPGERSRDRVKVGNTMRLLNRDIMGVAVALMLLCMAGACVNTFFDYGGSTVARRQPPWYLEGAPYSVSGAAEPSFADFMVAFMTYFLLCYQFIPISLYVSLATVQMITRYFVVQDVCCYDDEGDEPCQVRQVSLLDELGQVSHIFSDKTGTLTSNLMSFRRCYLCGVEYGVGETAIAKSLRAMAEDADRPPEVEISQRPPPAHGGCGPRASRYVGFEEAEGAPSLFDALEGDTAMAARHREFMLHQALNHSVLIETVGGQEELCASSPDEQAFVSAAEYFGYAFVARRPDVGELDIIDKRSGERHTVEVLEAFPYESSRKRMSILVRLPPRLVEQVGGGPAVRMYCKGADSVVLERLDPKDALSSPEVCRKMEELLYAWAEVALRTLVWAQRAVPDAEFEVWHANYRAASESPQEVARFKAGEPNQITALQEEAERGLQLQGATAIEDKLQEGVPEVLADLRSAGVKVWMLTGDKVGTAKNIATACNILPGAADTLELTTETYPVLGALRVADLLTAQEQIRAASASTSASAPKPTPAVAGQVAAAVKRVVAELDAKYAGLELVRAALSERAETTLAEARDTGSSAGGGIDRCFVLDEKAIEYLGLVCSEDLTVVGNGARSVVACRARKDQKAQMLELIRYGVPGSCCLAIGDGANDVAMIKAGHIGVGIIGKEGMEAVNNSDFAIGQFRFLRSLMLVHGRYSYRRFSTLCCFMFFKNIALVMALYWYSLAAAGSAIQVLPLFFVTWWNVFFSALPVVVYGFQDQDVPKEVSAEAVELYSKGLKRQFYTHTIFARWCAEAFYMGFVCSVAPMLSMVLLGYGDSVGTDGQPVDLSILGVAIMVNVTVCVNLRFALEGHSFGALESFVLALNFIGLELYALEILPILLGESKLFPPARQACESAPSTATYCPLPDNPYSIQAAYGHASFWLGIPMACLLSFGPRLAIKGWHGVVGTPTKNAMLVRSRRRDDRNSGKLRVLVEHDGGGSDGRPSTGGGDGSSTGPQIARRNTPTGYAFSESEPATCRVLTLTARRLGGATAQAQTHTHTHTGLPPPVLGLWAAPCPRMGGEWGGQRSKRCE